MEEQVTSKDGDAFVKRITIITVILCSTILCLAMVASAEQGLIYRDVRSIGMGDARIAGGRPSVAFVNNPALLTKVQGVRFSIPMLPFYYNDDLVDMGNFIKDNKDKFENFDELPVEDREAFLKDLEPYDGKWARVNVSPMVNIAGSFLGNSIGLAVYSTDDISFKVDRGIYEPRVWGEGATNTVVALGFAKPLTMLIPGLCVGANLKYIDRRTAPLFQIKASDLGDIEETIEPILDSANDNSESHYAMDLGTLWNVPLIDSDVGATIQNLGYAQRASVDFGIAKKMYNDRLVLQADYIDFFDNNKENLFKKIHFGGEYSISVLALRAGVSSGYPTVGAGLDFGVISIDAAYFIEELSNAPGVNEDERMAFQLRLGW